jgi:hypothetical protein
MGSIDCPAGFSAPWGTIGWPPHSNVSAVDGARTTMTSVSLTALRHRDPDFNSIAILYSSKRFALSYVLPALIAGPPTPP